jgi:hypothetical protein
MEGHDLIEGDMADYDVAGCFTLLYIPINLSQMDFEKIISAIFSNLSLNINIGKKKIVNKKYFCVLFQLHPDFGLLRVHHCFKNCVQLFFFKFVWTQMNV